jgi:pyocin large subunit-like protein
LALSWVSVSAKRNLTPEASATIPVVASPACFSAASACCSKAASSLLAALAGEICTAGDSPKKLGRV